MIRINNLETDIVDHCNLKCEHCAHHSPYITPGVYSVEEFERDVRVLSTVLQSEWFKIVGGEPTLNPNIDKYIDIIRQYNLSEKIALFTNGILLDRVDTDDLSQLNCLVVCEYKLGPLQTERIHQSVEKIRQTLPKLQIIHRKIDKFEQQNFTIKNTNTELVNKIWNRCKLRFECNVIYRGNFAKCIVTLRKSEFLKFNGISESFTEDLCPIHENNLKKRLIKYIYSNSSLKACSWCVGSCGKEVDNIQVKPVRNNFKIEDVIDWNIVNSSPTTTKLQYQLPDISRKTNYTTYIDIDGIVHTNKL